ncbi:hypothetical protein ACFC09_20685 [Streptomyces sp. NPDC056161]|uniref:hypothetical protein n=1 Tax=Streptomyces sp. NPDC056161 TaxID=3345732 RepID=UPI0035E1F087
MPADEVTHGTDVDKSRARTGPRHAAPRKPLFTRFHMPAGKAIATVAMPTAVIMGMGFTSTLALADNNDASAKASKSLTADEYKDCVAALKASPDASPSPSGSPSASESADRATPTPTPPASASADGAKDGSHKASSSDSGSDDKATPGPSASASESASPASSASGSGASGSGAATPGPSASAGGGLLGSLGGALTGILTGGAKDAGSSSSASPMPSPSASATDSADGKDAEGHKTPGDTVKDTVDKVTKSVGDTVKDTTGKVSRTVKDTTDAVDEAAGSVASPSSSASASADDCPVASDDTGGVDNKLPVADDPWNLDASSLLLKNADYQGIVEVKCANGTTKKVLKYVISGGTDIGDLHQTVKDKDAGKTYHVQAAPGSTSTIRDGDTVMYTESISGNLFGLIPVTFSPDSPPPLNIPLIYFTDVKVVQAAQFGGSLHVPGMHVYTTG